MLPAPGDGTADAPAPNGEPARVTAVMDGDTIEVELHGSRQRVRYIGIDAPEYGQTCSAEATQRNRALVAGKMVVLQKDVSETDRYGRLLRYVWVGNEMVNASLVRSGFALAATFPPDVKHQRLFGQLEQQARQAGAGCWSLQAFPTPLPWLQ